MSNRKLSLVTACSLVLIIILCLNSCNTGTDHYKDSYIQYEKSRISSEAKEVVRESLKRTESRYDPKEKMVTQRINGYNYHTDADSGVMHNVRGSFNYAISLLDLDEEASNQRAFEILTKVITLQDQDTSSRSCGVWPYYMEEPLATKKSPIDFNWADFIGVNLLDVWMGHQNKIPAELKPVIKNSLILAAKSIQKRNVGPSYTNIAIMGTYVTYMVSHLFNLPEMKEYSFNRLKNFYEYTLDKGGFTEYNSPTYTIIALDELLRMKKHIIEPGAIPMIDSLYTFGWETIASHYHQPTGQWAGPHSRSYGSLVGSSFYNLLKKASNGIIDPEITMEQRYDDSGHKIPEHLFHYFLSPVYPRTETTLFEKVEPQIIGTTYMTDNYAISTVSRSSLWIQRRPFLVYWGTVKSPKYLQVRFLHDSYDFSSASFFSQQKENVIVAGINFITNGGDKHISIDKIRDGKFNASDLRLRFEFGNVKNQDEFVIPAKADAPFSILLDQIKFNFQLVYSDLDGLKGRWVKGGDENSSWMDYVIYSGAERNFDLTKINSAAWSFIFSLEEPGKNSTTDKALVLNSGGRLKVDWRGLKIDIPMKPEAPRGAHL
jgi:hypothetical protein